MKNRYKVPLTFAESMAQRNKEIEDRSKNNSRSLRVFSVSQIRIEHSIRCAVSSR